MRGKLNITLLVLVSINFAGIAFGFAGGDGSEGNPYQISTKADLEAVDSNLTAHYILINNIDLTGEPAYNQSLIAPYIDNSSPRFTGSFDGNGNKIIGLTINADSNNCIGLFGYIGDGNVQDIGMENCDIVGFLNVGSLAGINSGTISNCYATGAVSGYRCLGGLVGPNTGTVSDCFATASVTGDLYVGGLVGSNSASVTECYSTGSVTGGVNRNNYYIGGLAGFNSGTIRDSYSTSPVSGYYGIGGLVGINRDAIGIAKCYSTGTVQGQVAVGGLAGANSGTTSDSYSTGLVSGDTEVGGLIGNNSGTTSDSYSTGLVSGDTEVGGLIGNNSGTTSDCYSTGPVSADSEVGGLIGYNSGTISDCYSAGGVTGSICVGGIVGWNDQGTISKGFWDIETSGTDIAYVERSGSDPDYIYTPIYSVAGIAEGKTTLEMMSMSTFFDAGWNFTDYYTGLVGNWYVPQDSYPLLVWQDDSITIIQVPDVSGLPLGQAQDLLETVGFTVGQAIYLNSFSVAPDAVIKLSVLQGAEYLSTISPIDIYVSNGSTGDGSEMAPYEVSCEQDIVAVNNDLAACYILRRDIQMLGSYSTAVIAPDTVPGSTFQGTAFTGTFDGNGFEIVGLNIDGGSNYYIGLFGKVGSGGQIQDLGLQDSDISGQTAVGGLVSSNELGSITGCYSTGSFRCVENSVGGLAGGNSGSITGCYSTGSVSGGEDGVGGLLGSNWGIISNCYSTASASGYYDVGGLSGSNSGSVSSSFSTGSVSGYGTVGGLVGYNYNNSSITDCNSSGSVSGVAGCVGGLVGYNSSSLITNCHSTGPVSGGSYVGGLVGSSRYYRIENSYSTGSVSGTDYVGGLLGFNDDSSVLNCYSTGSVSASSGSYYTGGLVGRVWSGSILNSYSTGPVSGDTAVGGLTGSAKSGGITNCYSTGSVSGDSLVGGLVGSAESGGVTSCYSTGSVSSTSEYVGGLMGLNNSCTASRNFWDVETSGLDIAYIEQIGEDPYTYPPIYSTVGVAEGKTTTQMQTLSTFTGAPASWDFVGETANGEEDIWKMRDGYSYPILSWQVLAEGDFAGDYRVNIFDFAVLANSWGCELGDGCFDDLLDLDGSGEIDIADLEIIASNWLSGPK